MKRVWVGWLSLAAAIVTSALALSPARAEVVVQIDKSSQRMAVSVDVRRVVPGDPTAAAAVDADISHGTLLRSYKEFTQPVDLDVLASADETIE